MADSQAPTLKELSAKISELSESFTAYLNENKIPAPTFAADSVTSYDGLNAEMFVTRQLLLDKLMDMYYLVSGPSESVFNYVHNCMPDVAVLGILNHFDFWSAVPLDGTATYASIAKKVDLPEEIVQRVVEHAKTLRIFADSATEAGKIQHSSRSAALAKQAGLRALVSTILDDAGPPMTVMPHALDKFNRGQETLPQDMTKTAFNLFHGGKYANSWEYIENDGEGERKGWRSRNFTTFMNYLKEIFRLDGIVEGAYDWKAAGKVKVVDLGGSAGHDSFVLAQKFPEMDITVEDLPKVESVFKANVPDDLSSRVRFVAHDFFQPQPVEADIYMIKLILHDWPDNECVRILQGLRPALRPGAKVLFIDYVGKQDTVEEKKPGDESSSLPRSIQQMGTSTDLRMMALFSAKERAPKEWKALFKAADERFNVTRFEANPLSFFVVIEAVWQG